MPVILVKGHLADSRLDERILRFMQWFGNPPHGVALPEHSHSESWTRPHFVARLPPSR